MAGCKWAHAGSLDGFRMRWRKDEKNAHNWERKSWHRRFPYYVITMLLLLLLLLQDPSSLSSLPILLTATLLSIKGCCLNSPTRFLDQLSFFSLLRACVHGCVCFTRLPRQPQPFFLLCCCFFPYHWVFPELLLSSGFPFLSFFSFFNSSLSQSFPVQTFSVTLRC